MQKRISLEMTVIYWKVIKIFAIIFRIRTSIAVSACLGLKYREMHGPKFR
jgi:galactitol-specific phosphotransferase system IIC component